MSVVATALFGAGHIPPEKNHSPSHRKQMRSKYDVADDGVVPGHVEPRSVAIQYLQQIAGDVEAFHSRFGDACDAQGRMRLDAFQGLMRQELEPPSPLAHHLGSGSGRRRSRRVLLRQEPPDADLLSNIGLLFKAIDHSQQVWRPCPREGASEAAPEAAS